MKKISFVIPCYNEEECVLKFYERANKFVETLSDFSYEYIFVDDGSIDNTKKILFRLADMDKHVKVVSFSKNFGQQSAILCGFSYATGDCVVELDADLQDPIETVKEMIEKWNLGYKVVHGKRRSRKGESWFKKFTAKVFNFFFNKICRIKLPANTGDFKLYDKVVIKEILSLPEKQKYMRGVASFVGYKQCEVEFDREERQGGKTNYNFKKLSKLATNAVIANSNFPLMLPFYLGFIILNLVGLVFTVFTILLMFKICLPLTAWLFPFIAFFFGILFIIKGVNNLYIDKIYEQAKARPDYIVEDSKNCD